MTVTDAKPKPTAPRSRVRRREFGRNHAYYLRNADGTESKLDGVTSLLGDGLAKPALVNWAGNTTAEYAVDNWDELGSKRPSERLSELKGARMKSLDAAGRRGTEVHELAERLLNGQQVDVPDEIAGHVDSAVRFLDQWQVEPVLSETTVCNATRGYAGTLDFVFRSLRFPGDVFCADWKSTRSGIFNEAALQVSAYANSEFYQGADGADHPTAGLGITRHVGVWLRSDGYDVYALDSTPRTFETFLYIAAVARRSRAWKDAPLVGAPMRLS